MSSPFEAHYLEPQTPFSQSDILGVYALPIAANMQNSGDRLQAMVNRTGIPFIVSDLLAQNRRTIFDMAAKDANQPTGDVYRDMSQRRLDFVEEKSEEYQPRILLGMADSLGVPAIQGMQLHREDRQGFNALLLRDGWNLGRSSGKATGMARYLGYQIRDMIHQKRDGVKFDIPKAGWEDTRPSQKPEVGGLGAIRNVADLMRGPHNRRNAVILAGECATQGVALNIVLFENGLSGTIPQQEAFIKDLRAAHNQAHEEHGAYGRLRHEIVPGWHSDLLDPARGAQDVRDTINLMA